MKSWSYYFCLMMERSGAGSGTVLVTNGSGCGSGRPKNIRIRIPNTAGTSCQANREQRFWVKPGFKSQNLRENRSVRYAQTATHRKTEDINRDKLISVEVEKGVGEEPNHTTAIRKKAWSSTNHSTLSGSDANTTLHRFQGL